MARLRPPDRPLGAARLRHVHLHGQRLGRRAGHDGPWFPAGWPEREIGWSVWRADAEGKGFAYEAATAARAHAFTALGWDTAVSYIDPENTRSIALAERMGASRDDKAAHPGGDLPCYVYRHPAPGGAA